MIGDSEADIRWVDLPEGEKIQEKARFPYERAELLRARAVLDTLDDAAPATLPDQHDEAGCGQAHARVWPSPAGGRNREFMTAPLDRSRSGFYRAGVCGSEAQGAVVSYGFCRDQDRPT